MPKRYEFFDHTADIGVHIYGATLGELFTNAAAALYEVLGELKKTEDRRQKTVELRTESREDLLHDWLSELLYEIEANHTLYDEISLLTVGGITVPDAISRSDRPNSVVGAPAFELRASLRGSTIDFARSQTNEEIKAITYHQLCVERAPDKSWRATIIFDV